MNWFLNLSTRSKLYLAFGIVLVFFISVLYLATSAIMKLKERQGHIVTIDFKVTADLTELRANLNRQRAKILEMIYDNNQNTRHEVESEINQSHNETNEIFRSLLSYTKDEVPFLDEIAALKDLFDAYSEKRNEQIRLIHSGRAEEAARLGETIQKINYENIRSKAIEIGSLAKTEVGSEITFADEYVNSTTMKILIIGLLILTCIVIMVYYLDKLIAKPIMEIKDYAIRVAGGDLDFKIVGDGRNDEIGELRTSFCSMMNTLKDLAAIATKIAEGDLRVNAMPKGEKDILAHALNVMVENLKNYTNELKETVNILSASSSEIFSGAAQLAAGAAETASAIGETSATVEEVKRTLELSNIKSKEVLEVTKRATEYSEIGQKSTEDTKEGINLIGSQMGIIAENILKLTEQSKSISDIINAVNELAEQSGILSVNASIEAARAGEHGKAFAVVAQEIKSLAEQSKQSTSQIKSILNDIQNAINSAVLATEQGEKIVDAGIKLSIQSGQSIYDMIKAISVTKDSAIQTSVTNQEQVIGMEQIAVAMGSIKIASSQNAATTKNFEKSAKDLQDLGYKLKELTSNFKI